MQDLGNHSGRPHSHFWPAAILQICAPAEHHGPGGHQLQLPVLLHHGLQKGHHAWHHHQVTLLCTALTQSIILLLVKVTWKAFCNACIVFQQLKRPQGHHFWNSESFESLEAELPLIERQSTAKGASLQDLKQHSVVISADQNQELLSGSATGTLDSFVSRANQACIASQRCTHVMASHQADQHSLQLRAHVSDVQEAKECSVLLPGGRSCWICRPHHTNVRRLTKHPCFMLMQGLRLEPCRLAVS